MTRMTAARLTAALSEAIVAGHHKVGDLLPTELELAAQYDTSRHTVRLALQELQQLGLVSRRKNVGTRVESARPAANYKQALTSIEGVVQFGKAHMREVIDVADEVADLTLAQTLGCAGGTRWLRISSLRRNRDDVANPIGWTDAYLDPAYRDIIPRVRDNPQELISSLIEANYGVNIVQIRQDIEAVALPARVAGPLNAEAGSPALRILRSYIDTTRQTIEISVTYHPASRFRLTMSLDRHTD